MTVAIPVLVLGAAGATCGLILAVAARLLAVREDPRVQALAEALPGLNCGACGYAGCFGYAKALAEKGEKANLCKAVGPAGAAKLASLLNVEVVTAERHVAIVLCGGSHSVTLKQGIYNGIADCAAAMLVSGGEKACRYGCIGLGTCARTCPVGAIEIRDGLAVVHPDLCIGCEQCVASCPRGVIRMVPAQRRLHVLCMSKCRGAEVKSVCAVGCIGCTLCVKAVGGVGIAMDGALAVVDYAVQVTDSVVVEKCPQHTIVMRDSS